MASAARTAPRKRVGGKRHLLVDTQGPVLWSKVHRAAIRDRASVSLLLEGAQGHFPRLGHV